MLIDITKDATAELADYEKKIPEKVDNYKIDSEVCDFERAIKLIEEAERPLIYAGGGIIAYCGV